MLMLTVLAAGAAALSTGVVVMKSTKDLPDSSGNTVTVLCLCSAESEQVFRAVLESELDDTAKSADKPGYRLVFRTVDTSLSPAEQGRRFASVMVEARASDHRSTEEGDPFGGVVMDAAGAAAFVRLHTAGGIQDAYMPDFAVVVSPAPGKSVPLVDDKTVDDKGNFASFAHWSCDEPKDPKPFASIPVSAYDAAFAEVPRVVVLQGMESPYAGMASTAPGTRGKVTVREVPNKRFLVFDVERVCPGKKVGGADASRFTAEQLEAARKERRVLEPEAEKSFKLPDAVSSAMNVTATRGQNLCGGLIRQAVDSCVQETALAPHAELARENFGTGVYEHSLTPRPETSWVPW